MDRAAWSIWGLVDYYEPLVCCLEEITDSDKWNSETRADTQSLFLALSRFPFIIVLIVTKDVLAYTKALSRKIQGRYVDVVRAYEQVTFVKPTLNSARDDVDRLHTQIYDNALLVAAKVHVEQSLPRTPQQCACCNCTGVLQVSVDYLHAGLHHCWDGREVSTWIISHCLPDHAFATIKTGSKWGDLNTSANIADFVSLYGDDLPPPASLDTELHCWSVKWQGHSSESQGAASLHSPAKALATIDSDFSQMFSSSRLLVHWLWMWTFY